MSNSVSIYLTTTTKTGNLTTTNQNMASIWFTEDTEINDIISFQRQLQGLKKDYIKTIKNSGNFELSIVIGIRKNGVSIKASEYIQYNANHDTLTVDYGYYGYIDFDFTLNSITHL